MLSALDQQIISDWKDADPLTRQVVLMVLRAFLTSEEGLLPSLTQDQPFEAAE
jgi:hypothetical protein